MGTTIAAEMPEINVPEINVPENSDESTLCNNLAPSNLSTATSSTVSALPDARTADTLVVAKTRQLCPFLSRLTSCTPINAVSS